MIKYFVKKWVVGQVNDVLEEISDNDKVMYWKKKITDIINFLQNILKYIDDNKISDEETDKIINECKGLF